MRANKTGQHTYQQYDQIDSHLHHTYMMCLLDAKRARRQVFDSNATLVVLRSILGLEKTHIIYFYFRLKATVAL